jgi:hypothetical protein
MKLIMNLNMKLFMNFDYEVDYDSAMFMIMLCLDNPMMLHDYC